MVFRRTPDDPGDTRVQDDPPGTVYRERADGVDLGYPRSAYPYGPTYSVPDDSFGSSAASAVTFLAGVWLIVSPFALGHTATGGEFGGYWNDVTVGIVIALLALVRAVAPREVPWFSMVNIALGGWLILAPWVLAYNEGADAVAATTNDMIVGAVVVLAAAVSVVLTFRRRARVREEARRAGRRSAEAAG
ncbi:SPW repeat protein [Actinophytocola glycyrrhizae]|uniref:SPW repeat protein n=1 Tax=Actinophytocola glycyrrhizae TaxID=2044873 RepID=A0ABV9RZJ2_9PSEU